MTVKTIGKVDYLGKKQVIEVPPAYLVLGGAAAGCFVGLQIGGPQGAAVGAIVGAFVGSLAVGFIRKFRVIIKPSGEIVVEFETVFDKALA